MSGLALYRKRQLASAKARWRDAAHLVSMRWDAFLRSERETRAFRFTSYVSALDAEEAAAAEMSRLMSSPPRYGTAA